MVHTLHREPIKRMFICILCENLIRDKGGNGWRQSTGGTVGWMAARGNRNGAINRHADPRAVFSFPGCSKEHLPPLITLHPNIQSFMWTSKIRELEFDSLSTVCPTDRRAACCPRATVGLRGPHPAPSRPAPLCFFRLTLAAGLSAL